MVKTAESGDYAENNASGCVGRKHAFAALMATARIGDFAQVSPSATLCGNVVVEQGTDVDAGATIIQEVKIGRWSTVNAGAVVIRDMPDFATVVRCPAKQLN